MTIKMKSFISFAAIFIAFIVMQLFQYFISEAQWKELKKIEDYTLNAALMADDLKLSVVQVQQWLTDISATRGTDGLDDGFDQAAKYAAVFHENLKQMKRMYPQEAQMFDETEVSFARYYEMGQKMANEYIAGGNERGNQIMGEFDKSAEDINKRIDELRNSKLTEITNAVSQIEQTNKSNNKISVIYLVLVLAIGLVVVYLHSRSVIRPLKRLIHGTKRIAEGDLSQSIPSDSKDEIGQLALSFEAMRQNLAALIERIKTAGEQVAASSEQLTSSVEETVLAANQIAAATEEIANGSDMQATGAEESSKAIEELAIGVQRIAEISGEVAGLSDETAKAAGAGNESIQQAIQKMDMVSKTVHESSVLVRQLGERSNEINRITEVLSAITSQTELLALNAAIEASRAGEQGKGFAVVAGEVKKLAEQSKQSADMIADMIRKVQDDTFKVIRSIEIGTREADEGNQIMQRAGAMFQNIVADSEKIAAQLEEVSVATEQMSAGSEQITASIVELNHIAKASYNMSRDAASFSQEQLASMEGISASAQTLRHMAQELNNSVHRFKVDQ
ncbi:methyl-accepting chemotaxis protein [Brevibacillus sp. B_LB10_24]|uniref:methyl-accepting chemotaxis protein n=1 Tax=Brevibacillus sp. B_LB10_24 TaxID=3380645 RepID=UPI0038BA33F5